MGGGGRNEADEFHLVLTLKYDTFNSPKFLEGNVYSPTSLDQTVNILYAQLFLRILD